MKEGETNVNNDNQIDDCPVELMQVAAVLHFPERMIYETWRQKGWSYQTGGNSFLVKAASQATNDF